MAYSNWGAFVYRNGERQENREDVGVFDEDEAGVPSGGRIFHNLAKNMDRFPDGKTPWWAHSHHAVLGDGPVRLCGYKASPELWWRESEDATPVHVDLTPYVTTWGDGDDPVGWYGEYRGHLFTAQMIPDSRSLILLTLITPTGDRWFSRCGYLYGAGHMEVDPQGPEEVR